MIGVVIRGDSVAQADIDRLFNPFFTTKEHGTGLGLPVRIRSCGRWAVPFLAQANAG